MPGAAAEIAAVCTGHDYARPGKPKTGWDDPQAKDALVSALVNDANALVAALRDRDLDERAARRGRAAGAARRPRRRARRGHRDGTDGRWRIARKVAAERVISTVDPETRHAHKPARARHDGYKAHVKVEPDTGIITDES